MSLERYVLELMDWLDTQPLDVKEAAHDILSDYLDGLVTSD